MKKLTMALALVAVLGLVSNVAFTDETVTFPFWQHTITSLFNLTTFFSVSNDASAPSSATVTINYLQADGTLVTSTTGTVAPGTAWFPDTRAFQGWYTYGNNSGFGTFDITSAGNYVSLWGCVYGLPGDGSQPGFTIVLPGNPYGAGK